MKISTFQQEMYTIRIPTRRVLPNALLDDRDGSKFQVPTQRRHIQYSYSADALSLRVYLSLPSSHCLLFFSPRCSRYNSAKGVVLYIHIYTYMCVAVAECLPGVPCQTLAVHPCLFVCLSVCNVCIIICLFVCPRDCLLLHIVSYSDV